jgi:hypothetical protein
VQGKPIAESPIHFVASLPMSLARHLTTGGEVYDNNLIDLAVRRHKPVDSKLHGI